MRGSGPRESGGASVLVAGVLGAVVLLGTSALLVAAYSLDFHQARSAADLVALSAAVEQGEGGAACVAAAKVAQRNASRLIACEVVGAADDYVVSIEVEVAAHARVRGLPATVRARAHAGPFPGAGGQDALPGGPSR